MTLRVAVIVLVATLGSASHARPIEPADVVVPDSSAPVASAPIIDIDSREILARSARAETVLVRYVIVPWDGLPRHQVVPDRRGRPAPPPARGTNAEAAAKARKILADLRTRTGADPQALLTNTYVDTPAVVPGDPEEVYGATQVGGMREGAFKELSLRLRVGESGCVRTEEGYVIIARVAPDPLESSAILARTRPATRSVWVKHVAVRWKAADDTGPGLTRDAARVRATEILEQVRRGAAVESFAVAGAALFEDRGEAYEITPETDSMLRVPHLARRLRPGEVGVVFSSMAQAWYVVKRMLPDRLESNAVLARAPVTRRAKVQAIALVAEGVDGGDPPGVPRTRARLEQLVASSIVTLRKGQSPQTADSIYRVTPDADLAPPFIYLALRLRRGEIGVIKTQDVVFVIKRVN